MQLHNYQTIVAIAHDVRLDMEMYAEDNDFPKDLTGLCAIASSELFTRLKRKGLSPVICLNVLDSCDCHVFVVVEDHIVDITATQFGKYNNVVITEFIDNQKQWFWNAHRAFTSVKELHNHQRKTGWIEDQIVMIVNNHR